MAGEYNDNFPNKKHDYLNPIIDIKPEKRDDVILGLLCNILIQTRENRELIHQLFRALSLNISGFEKQKLEQWYEEDSIKFSLFLSRFAQNIHFDPKKDIDEGKK